MKASIPTVRRHLLLPGGIVLVLVLVFGYAAFSLVETERKALAAAEAEGRALLGAVSAGIERSLTSSRAIERLLAERLLEVGRDLGRRIAESPGREDWLVRDCAVRHRLKGVILLDAGFLSVATAGPPRPPPAGRPHPRSPLAAALEPMAVANLVRRARAAGLGVRDPVEVGFGESPFGARVEFLVATSVEATGGYLLLRQDAERLRAERRQAGVEQLLVDAAESEAIAYLMLQDRDGTVRAASDPERIGERLAPAAEHAAWRETGEGRVLDLALPVSWEGTPEGSLRVGLTVGPVEAVIRRGRESILLFTGVAVLLGAGGAVGLVLADRSRRRKEAALEKELGERERVAALGRLAAGVAHEIRSPLNAIGMGVQRLSRRGSTEVEDPESVRTIAEAVRREVDRLNRTVEEFLSLGRTRPLEIEEVDLFDLLREAARAEAPDARIEAPAEAVTARADREEVRKAAANLLRNAVAASAGAPVVAACRADGEFVVLEVRDGGPGVPREDRDRVFEHFHTRRPGGTGLGLAIVRTVAERHGGTVSVDDAPEGGARFMLRLPRWEAR